MGKYLIIAVLFLSLAVRIIYVSTLDRHKMHPPDAMYWDSVAVNIINGNGHALGENESLRPTAFRTPLYSLFLAGTYRIFGHDLLFVRIIQSLLNAISCLLIYIIGKRLFNEWVGAIAFLISGFYPSFIYYSGFIGAESLLLFLFLIVLISLLRFYETISVKHGITTGIITGLATLAKPVFFLFLFFLLPWFLSTNLKWRILKAWGISFIFTLLVIAPWTIRNFIVFDSFILLSTEGGQTFWTSNNSIADGTGSWYKEFEEMVPSELPETEREKIWYTKTFGFIRNNPGKFLLLIPKKIIRLYRLYPQEGYSNDVTRGVQIISLSSYGLILPFAAFGFFRSLRGNKKILLMHLSILYFTLLAAVFYGSTRLRLPIEPILIIFASLIFVQFLMYIPVAKKRWLTRNAAI